MECSFNTVSPLLGLDWDLWTNWKREWINSIIIIMAWVHEKSWRHLILTRYLRNLTLCFCGLRSTKLSVVVMTVVVPFFSFWFSEMLSGLNLSYSYSHGEWRTDRARQLFFLQALNVYLETSFLLGLLKWAIAALASYLRQESCYCFSTALQQQTCNDLVYTLYHMIVNT